MKRLLSSPPAKGPPVLPEKPLLDTYNSSDLDSAPNSLTQSLQQSRPGPFRSKHVHRIAKRTLLNGQTPTSNTLVHLVSQAQKSLDPIVKISPPPRRQARPVIAFRATILRKRRERLLNRSQRNPQLLRRFDDRDAP